MKICEKAEGYAKLNRGEVFGWFYYGEPRTAMKTAGGYTHLSGVLCGTYVTINAHSEATKCDLTYYPNACITLGDPE